MAVALPSHSQSAHGIPTLRKLFGQFVLHFQAPSAPCTSPCSCRSPVALSNICFVPTLKHDASEHGKWGIKFHKYTDDRKACAIQQDEAGRVDTNEVGYGPHLRMLSLAPRREGIVVALGELQ